MKLAALPQSEERLRFEGFSVMPPQEGHWCVEHLDKKTGVVLLTSPVLGRVFTERPSPDESSHSFALQAVAVEIEGTSVDTTPQLRDFVAQWLRAGGPSRIAGGKMILSAQARLQPGRFDQVTADFAEDSSLGAQCVRFDVTTQEFNNPYVQGDTLRLVENSNLLCRSPRSKTPVFIWIGASERYSWTHEPSWKYFDTAQSEVESFTHSLEFSDQP
jgi:hypothetical protein